jgi:hypothetical protein
LHHRALPYHGLWIEYIGDFALNLFQFGASEGCR